MLPRRPLDHRGVSEVIGTILILLITVILFSTIVVWVFTLPTPRAASNVGIDGTLEWRSVAGSGPGAYVNLTHLGGDDLLDTNTRIYLTIDNQTHTFRTRGFEGALGKPYGVNGPDVQWNIGETWSYENETINRTARISVLVVDVVRGTVIWDQVLLGEDGKRMPVFLEKWVDSKPSSPSRDPVGVGDTFAIYARVGDPDGDLNPASVSAYITFGYDSPLGPFPLLDNGDGVFSRTLSFAALRSWDGGIIILTAADMDGREAQTRLVLKVLDTGTTSQVQGPGTLGFGSDVQRYDIFEIGDWDENGWEATSTRNFIKEQGVVVVVASKRIPNPDLKNTFLLWNPYFNNRQVVYSEWPYTNPVTESSIPSTTNAFELTEFISGFYIYEYRFNTASAVPPFDGFQLELGYYPLEFELITSQTPSPENRLYVTDAIRVTSSSGGSLDYPRLETYKDPGHTMPATNFTFTEILYVRVIVADTDDNITIGDVIVSDFIGNLPIWASPGVAPISDLIPDAVSYAFAVDLSKPNLDPWNFGTVSYNLAVMNVQDANEAYARLSGQITVTGPRWKLDIAIGLMSTSQQNFDMAIYGDFFDNVEGWTDYPYETFLASPGNKAPVNPITSQVLGDLDGDGDLDLLAGTEMGQVWWYRNRDGKAHSMTRSLIDLLGSSVSSVAVGHVDQDPDLDAAVGTTTGDVWWYRNDGAWSHNLVDNVGVAVTDLQLADVNGDGAADLIVALSAGPDSVRVYLNNGQGVFGKVATTTTLVDLDVWPPGHGTVSPLPPPPSYLPTTASDDLYQQVTEVASDRFPAASEMAEPVETGNGSYEDTHEDDGDVQILTEGSALPQYTLGFPGHRYLFPNITATALDTLEVHLTGYISSGFEPFAVGWSKDEVNVTWASGLITGRTKGEYIWSISEEAWSDETLYLHIMDVDSILTDPDRDDQLTSLSVDLLYVLQPGDGDFSTLLKVWRSAPILAGMDAYRLFAEAHHTFNAENDDFVLKVAGAPHGPYYGLLPVTKTTDDDGNQSISLPTSIGGNHVYIQAQDTDRTDGATVLDSVWVDHLFLKSYVTTPGFWPIGVGGPTDALAVADVDGDGHQDIVVASDATVYVFYGDGTGKAWPAGDILDATDDVLTLDVGYVSADAALDIVVGTQGKEIHLFTNPGSRGLAWPRSTIDSLVNTMTSTLRVGDVDGDNWDDVVYGTENGALVYLHNDQGNGWTKTTVIQMPDEDRIEVIDIGDADRGVIIRTHPY